MGRLVVLYDNSQPVTIDAARALMKVFGMEEALSLPEEKYRSLLNMRLFMHALMDSKKTPRVPRCVRVEASYMLKHFPSIYEIEMLAKKCPKILKREKL